MNILRRTWLALPIAALALVGAGQNDESEISGTVTEGKELSKDIEQQAKILETLAVEVKQEITGGKSVDQAVADIAQKYAALGQKAPDSRVKENLSVALEVLKSEKVHEALARGDGIPPGMQSFVKRAQSPSLVKLEALAGGDVDWDGAGKRAPFRNQGTGTDFFGTASGNRWQVPVRIREQADNARPHAQRARGLHGDIENLSATFVRNATDQKKLEADMAKGKEERQVLAQSVAAAAGRLGPLPATATTINQEMSAIKLANDGVVARNKELVARMNTLNSAIERRNATLAQYQKQIDANPTAFYNRNKADCDVTNVERKADGSTITHWIYRPGKALVAQNKADRATWDQLSVQNKAYLKEMDSQVERWNALKLKRDAIYDKEKLARLDLLQKERLERIEQLKLDNSEVKRRLTQLLEQLREYARNLRDWVRNAKESVDALRQGR